MQESADLIRSHYLKKNYNEREVFNVDKNFNWSNFSQTAANLSLFSAQKIIELRLSSAKLEDAGKKAIQQYLDAPSPDLLILISSPKLESSTLKTKWFTQIESSGALVQVWPVSREHLGAWLQQRLKQQGIQAEAEALAMLADKVEGNLLAAMQEIEKLKLLCGKQQGETVTLDAKTVMQLVADHSRYSVYQLIDAALLGDTARSQKMLSGLHNEGVYPLIILGAITRELRSLLPMLEKREQGQGVNAIIQSARVWFNRKQAVSTVLARLHCDQAWRLLDHCRLIDQSIKGMSSANTWDELSLLLLNLSGSPVTTASKLAS